MKRTIIIMAKVPRAGNVKTRLQPFLSPAECETLAEAFLRDTLSKVQNAADQLIITYAPAGEKKYFDDFLDEKIILIEQHGANLGEKMSAAFEFAFGKTSDANVILIGTDSPTFPTEFIETSFTHLESDAKIVLGKSDDGGFYLIGLRKFPPGLFERIEWSSPLVFQQISQNIEKLNLESETISEWFDVDAPDDLRRLRDDLAADENSRQIAPRTDEWIILNRQIFDAKD